MNFQRSEKYARFVDLHRKFRKGLDWFEKQEAAGRDTRAEAVDFCGTVLRPLDALYNSMTPAERATVDTGLAVAEQVKGTLSIG